MIFNTPSLKRFYKTTPITFLNALAITVMYLVTLVTGGTTSANLLRLGALFTPSVEFNNEWWRLFTVMYLHGSFTHFLFNTFFGLIIIGATLERLIGSMRYFIIYFGSGLLASLTIYVVYLITGNPTLGVGASGAIYGVMGAFLFLTYYRPSWFSGADTSSIRGLIFVNIIFTVLVPNISISAHLGGLAAGYLLSFVAAPSKRMYQGMRQGFETPHEETYDPFDIKDPFDHLEDITVVDDDDDPEDPWGRYSS
jgi:rhomboid protease GluP